MQVSLLSMQNAIIRLSEASIPTACGPRPKTSHDKRSNSDSCNNLNMSTFCMLKVCFSLGKSCYFIDICTGSLVAFSSSAGATTSPRSKRTVFDCSPKLHSMRPRGGSRAEKAMHESFGYSSRNGSKSGYLCDAPAPPTLHSVL